LIQHIYDNDFCSPAIKARDETEQGCITKMLRNGKRISKVEYHPKSDTSHTMVFILNNNAVFAQFDIHCIKPYKEMSWFTVDSNFEFHTFEYEIGPGAYLLYYHPNLNEHEDISQQLTMPNPDTIDELPVKEQNELRRLAKSTTDKVLKI
jgi:hypothetical protein